MAATPFPDEMTGSYPAYNSTNRVPLRTAVVRGVHVGLALPIAFAPGGPPAAKAMIRPEERSVKLARDTWLILQRQILLMVRSPVWLTFGMTYPVTYLLLFAPMLKRALGAEGVTPYSQAYRVYVPGLLALMAFLGGMVPAFGLLSQIRSGIIDPELVTR